MDDFVLTLDDIEKTFTERTPGVIGKYSKYAVLVPLVDIDGELNLLFEVRASGLKRQPGEICFPGGRMERGETAKECALRETAEEIGIDVGAIRVITRLDSLHAYSNFTLYSFLGEIKYDTLSDAKPNAKEVESIFFIPVSEFVKNDPFIYKMEIVPNVRDDFPYDMVNSDNGYDWRKGVSEVPIYRIRERNIWGLTARITHNMVKILNEKPRDY